MSESSSLREEKKKKKKNFPPRRQTFLNLSLDRVPKDLTPWVTTQRKAKLLREEMINLTPNQRHSRAKRQPLKKDGTLTPIELKAKKLQIKTKIKPLRFTKEHSFSKHKLRASSANLRLNK